MVFYEKKLLLSFLLLSLSAFSMADPIEDALVLAKLAANNGDYTAIKKSESVLKKTIFDGYPSYWWILKNNTMTSSEKFVDFLKSHENGMVYKKVQTIFLKKLAAEKKWPEFSHYINGLKEKDLELKCYESSFGIATNGRINNSDYMELKGFIFNERKTSEGCYQLIFDLYINKIISEIDLWAYVRLFLSGNQISYAKKLSELTESPISPYLLGSAVISNSRAKVESTIFDFQKSFNSKSSEIDFHKFLSKNSHLNSLDVAYLWGRFALIFAKKLKSDSALIYFNKSDPLQLTEEQWTWWVRSALRVEDWDVVLRVIDKMPQNVADQSDWLYWKARALKAKNRNAEANVIFNRLKNLNGFSYYSILSQEELGLNQKNDLNKDANYKDRSEKIKIKPEINRALFLLKMSINKNDPSFREDAKREWRFAMRNLSDEELLSASELARRHDFYEMAIYSAEQTYQIHDKSLRYLTPYREFLESNSTTAGLSQSWVYGLIRQESRFVNVARSGVGASGLMQLMPATAKWVAGKVGIGAFDINDINTNIKLGTWYLSHVTDTLGHPVLATAAYNAGPGRAKSWQANRSLEGAIYAETIPFDETRDYVKKVMSNTVIYDSMLNNKNMRLKDILGSIPAR